MKIKKKTKTIEHYNLRVTKRELEILAALVDFPDWIAQGTEVYGELSDISNAIDCALDHYCYAGEVFKSSKTSFIKEA